MSRFLQYLTLTLVSISYGYASDSYWVSGGKLTTCGRDAIHVLENAEEDGLNPADYQFAVNAARSSPATAGAQINKAMIKYVNDIRTGGFNPRIADSRIHMVPQPVNAAAIVAKGKKSGSCRWMIEQAPPYPGYQRLKGLMIRFLREGKRDLIPKIKINMERWRWMPRDHGSRYIIVNVAGYQLEAVQNGKTALVSPVIIGRPSLPTPVFKTTITDIEFNPEWHVPHNLAVRDELPRIKRYPNYLSYNHMVIYEGNRRVDPSTIDWSKYSARNFPFRIVQTPGPYNALGRIRFHIHDNFSIMMHSTDEKYLFKYGRRNFSHGCIRVKDVVGLAYFVLDNPSVWSRQRIAGEMEGYTTKRVRLSHAMPVYVNYFTMWVDQDGTAYEFPDAYGEDQRLWNVMSKR